MTADQDLASKLELIRDSITEFKFDILALEKGSAKIESELADCRSRIAELSNSEIRVGSQLATINKSMDAMSIDIRAVRNSVLSAILAAVIVWIGGTAFSTFYRSPVPTNHPTAK